MASILSETSAAFELKGEMSMFSVLRLMDSSLQRVETELTHQISKAPAFFQDMPVVIDLEPLADATKCPDFGPLRQLLNQNGLVTLGVRNGNPHQQEAARQAGLALLKARKTTTPPPPDTVRRDDAAKTPPHPKNRLIARPIRSGQQVYAAEGDLVIVAPVSPGSELLADGCIHVYGPLRGRALAGVNGDTTARIFCQRLEAELVAIAGRYRTSEDLDPNLKGRPVQIRLEGDRLTVSPL
jgi:septum site-determining protein MinC